jgi:hypothetical protein
MLFNMVYVEIYAFTKIRVMRPGLLELGVGLVFGVVSGVLFSQVLLIDLNRLALKIKEDPSLRWKSLLLGLPGGVNPVLLAVIFLVLLAVGIYGIYALVNYIWHINPDIQWPFAAFKSMPEKGTDPATHSTHIAFIVYLFTIVAAIWLRMLRWYYRLPR